MKNWEVLKPKEIPEGFLGAVGGNPLVSETLLKRGISDEKSALAYLNPNFYAPTSPLQLPGMDQAVTRILQSQKDNETVCVWGDFDVDGQTSTALLVSALSNLGIKVIYHVPLRENESHGVNIPFLKRIIGENYQPDIDLLMTCDTGISSNEALEYAHNRGIDVIITDHHDLPAKMPIAEAIINPKILPKGHALRNLPGVGVAYKLIEQLYEQCDRKNDCEQFQDLVALGIVSDVAYLAKDTRYLLQRGIECLRQSKRTGLKAMSQLIDVDMNSITEEHIGFYIGPRLNAVGRLDDAKKCVELLLTSDPTRANILALEFESLNARRKLLTNQVYYSALVEIEKNPELMEHNVLLISNPNWPAGVIGIVASRLVERFNKPVIMISSPEGEIARGSARSINGIDISGAISDNEEYLVGYGGHPMAAGLSIEIENIPVFRKAISNTVGEVDELNKSSLSIDGYLDLEQLSIELIEDIERLAPFGAGNPPLVFVSRRMNIRNYTTIGRDDEHLQLKIFDENKREYKVIWWNGAGVMNQDQFKDVQFDLAYTARGSKNRKVGPFQIEWIDYRIIETDETELIKQARCEVIDFRQISHPFEKLQELKLEGDVQILAESDAIIRLKRISGLVGIHDHINDRYTIQGADLLVVWTTPPGRFELNTILDFVSPRTIMYFCIEPEGGEIIHFLEKLTGLVKYGMKKYKGQLSITRFASALAQRESTVVKGLQCLEAGGFINIVDKSDQVIGVTGGNRKSSPGKKLIMDQLQVMLLETSAFRDFIKSVDYKYIETGI